MIVEMTLSLSLAQEMTGALSLTASAEIAQADTATMAVADVAPVMTITDELAEA